MTWTKTCIFLSSVLPCAMAVAMNFRGNIIKCFKQITILSHNTFSLNISLCLNINIVALFVVCVRPISFAWNHQSALIARKYRPLVRVSLSLSFSLTECLFMCLYFRCYLVFRQKHFNIQHFGMLICALTPMAAFISPACQFKMKRVYIHITFFPANIVLTLLISIFAI